MHLFWNDIVALTRVPVPVVSPVQLVLLFFCLVVLNWKQTISLLRLSIDLRVLSRIGSGSRNFTLMNLYYNFSDHWQVSHPIPS
jgi:hypothetical protein